MFLRLTLARFSSFVLRTFFCLFLTEVLIILAGIYLIRSREKLFGYKGNEGDTYASANLRLAMLVIIWIHAIIMNTIMIF